MNAEQPSQPGKSRRAWEADAREDVMNNLIRQTHRWTSSVFTLTVLANFAAMTQGPPPALVTYAPLLPLAVLLFSGMYPFVLPYAAGRRGGRSNA
jgi:hypothetical protein